VVGRIIGDARLYLRPKSVAENPNKRLGALCGPEEERSFMAISQTCAPSWKSASRIGVAEKPASDACFNDWKRFCFVLREIASGNNGRPLSGLEAQKRAQAVLAECGYTWPGRVQAREPVVAPVQDLVTQARVDARQSRAGTKLKSVGEARSRSGRRNDPLPREHRVSASLDGSPT
jgi:hypothetical protein